MKSSVLKMTARSIRSFWGRYVALLVIVFLGVGFFAGLKINTDAMHATCESYLEEQNFYDYRLFSTLGFEAGDVEALRALPWVEDAEGGKSLDVLIELDGSSDAYQLLSLPARVNLPSLVSGRLPTGEDECVVDAEKIGEDAIGKTLTVAGDAAGLTTRTLTVVGRVDSPLYLNLDRGSTSIGNGSLAGFIYVPSEAFASGALTEISLTLTERAEIYSEAYDALLAEHRTELEQTVNALAEARYQRLVEEMIAASGLPAALWTPELIAETAAAMGLDVPTVYILTRNENVGYVSFENDSAIVGGVANIFPVFFILIAMLVCVTTMTRMVDEERTQIGVLKAMGFGNGRVMAKYLLYAGSATLLGWVGGFFIGTRALPKLFWFAYSAIYGFTDLRYLFSPLYALLTLGVSMVAILGSTALCCRRELARKPADSIRPRPPKSGKKVLLERITPLWRRFSFLQKASLRNMFRYKPRLLMMLVGVGCCTALLVTAFGVRDSMVDVSEMQYDGIQTYELAVTLDPAGEDAVAERLTAEPSVEGYLLAQVSSAEATANGSLQSLTVLCFGESDPRGYWNLSSGGTALQMPARGQVLICTKTAEVLGLSVGDAMELRDAEMRTVRLTVGGVFDNYALSYAVVNPADIAGGYAPNTAYVQTAGDPEAVAELLTAQEQIVGVSMLSNTRRGVENGLSSIDFIVWVVVGFAAALAFIVIYNLTNINLAERTREIATVKVLGLYPREVYGYVLRENLILSVIAAVLGMPLGYGFHWLVMSMIKIDIVYFPTLINPVSYVLAFACTILFALLINQYMKRHIERIDMAESLKTVE